MRDAIAEMGARVIRREDPGAAQVASKVGRACHVEVRPQGWHSCLTLTPEKGRLEIYSRMQTAALLKQRPILKLNFKGGWK